MATGIRAGLCQALAQYGVCTVWEIAADKSFEAAELRAFLIER
jgi:hypothetical protein